MLGALATLGGPQQADATPLRDLACIQVKAQVPGVCLQVQPGTGRRSQQVVVLRCSLHVLILQEFEDYRGPHPACTLQI